jgi:hypothetical protein
MRFWLLLLLIPIFSFADDVDTSQYSSNQYLADQATIISGYTQPSTLPEVREIDHAAMSKLICHSRPLCPVLGAYLDTDIIYLAKGLEPVVHDNILVHEFVHWLQDHNGKHNLKNCIDNSTREREAYRVQNTFIAEVQHGFTFMLPPPIICP